MSQLANGTSLSSLAYRGIGVDFSNIEYVFSWSFNFWYETRKKDKYDIEGFLQDSERIQAVY